MIIPVFPVSTKMLSEMDVFCELLVVVIAQTSKWNQRKRDKSCISFWRKFFWRNYARPANRIISW